MKRKTRKKSPVKALDRLSSLIVRSVGSCEICGATERLQCAHGFSRRYRSVRWNFDNLFSLCAGCHVYYTYRPLEWDQWLRDRWGMELYEYLRALALKSKTVNMVELLPELQARWSELQEAA